jgi:hypothetical protein
MERQLMTPEIRVTASGEVHAALSAIGRAEDVEFSPDNRRVAIAGFVKNELLIVDVAIEDSADGKHAVLSNCVTIHSPHLHQPHGLAFLGNQALIVTNRLAESVVLPVPPPDSASPCVVPTLQTIGADGSHYLRSPGSVESRSIAPDLYEVLICSNAANYVTRHVLDAREHHRILGEEILLMEGIDLPDGVAVSHTREWIAISNHDTHCVAMFRNRRGLNHRTRPEGHLVGLHYPHAPRFTPDGRFVLVADAGAPYVRVYASEGDDWVGTRSPAGAIRVMDDAMFDRGHTNPYEGGPKGIDITADMRVCAITSEFRSLAFFDLELALAGVGTTRPHGTPGLSGHEPRASGDTHQGHPDHGVAEVAREALVRELLREAATDARMADLKSTLDARHAREMEQLHRSRSWRMTAPLRKANGWLRSWKH